MGAAVQRMLKIGKCFSVGVECTFSENSYILWGCVCMCVFELVGNQWMTRKKKEVCLHLSSVEALMRTRLVVPDLASIEH